MKKLFILLIVLIGAYFGLKKLSPSTLDKIAFWNKASQAGSDAQIPAPIPAPTPTPAQAPEPPKVEGTPPPVVAANPQPKTAEPPPPPTPAPEPVDKTAQVVVFCYHRLEGPSAGIYSITPELFEQHMQRLKDSNIHVISMRDFLAWRRGEKGIPARSALITLDDGYVSALEVARPILKKFGYPWTFFVYTNYIGKGGKSMSWEQLAELRDDGVEIGSHTVSHLDLRESRGKSAEAYDAWLREEIIGSKKLIEQKLGIRCDTFAYPFGGWNARIVELIKEADYSAAFTVFGQRLTFDAPAEKLGRYAWDNKRPQDIELAFRFLGQLAASGPAPVSPGVQPAHALLTRPLEGETVRDTQPLLKANLAALGQIDASSVNMRLSGVGVIPCKFDAATKSVEARPADPLKPGEYTATITAKVGGKSVPVHWTFHVDPNAVVSKSPDAPTPQ